MRPPGRFLAEYKGDRLTIPCSCCGCGWLGSADNIESNITSVGAHTSAAAEELTTAHDYQRKAGRRKLWLMIILIIVVAVVLLAVSSRPGLLVFLAC